MYLLRTQGVGQGAGCAKPLDRGCQGPAARGWACRGSEGRLCGRDGRTRVARVAGTGSDTTALPTTAIGAVTCRRRRVRSGASPPLQLRELPVRGQRHAGGFDCRATRRAGRPFRSQLMCGPSPIGAERSRLQALVAQRVCGGPTGCPKHAERVLLGGPQRERQKAQPEAVACGHSTDVCSTKVAPGARHGSTGAAMVRSSGRDRKAQGASCHASQGQNGRGSGLR